MACGHFFGKGSFKVVLNVVFNAQTETQYSVQDKKYFIDLQRLNSIEMYPIIINVPNPDYDLDDGRYLIQLISHDRVQLLHLTRLLSLL